MITHPAKRILYCLNSLSGGGAENGLLMLVKRGLFQGHHVHVLAITLGDGKVKEPLEQLLPASCITILSQSEQMRITHMLAALVYFPWLALKVRATIVFLSLEQSNIIGRFWAHFMPWLRVYSFEHSIHYSKAIYGHILKALSWPVKGILCDSVRTLQAVRTKWFMHPQKLGVTVIPLFSVDKNKRTKSNYAAQGPLKLVSAGRLAFPKNQKEIIQAMYLLKQQGVATSLTLYGEGNDHAVLVQQAEVLDLADAIHFKGYVPTWSDDLEPFDIYLQPSKYEGLCITLLEAMAYGMPCIASPVGEIPFYGKEGKNILFLKQTDAKHIAETVKALGDAKMREYLGRNAAESIRDIYRTEMLEKALNDVKTMIGLTG